MKILLAALVVLPLAWLSAGSGIASPAAVDDPPPVECPFCGGNVVLHGQVVSALTATQTELARRALVAFYQ